MKFLLMMIVSLSLFAQDWTSFDKAKEIALNECKPILVIVYQDDCSACIQLFDKINSSFVLKSIIDDYVEVRMEIKEAIAKYGAGITLTPTMMILSPTRVELLKPILGLPSDTLKFIDYLQLGIIASSETKCDPKTIDKKMVSVKIRG